MSRRYPQRVDPVIMPQSHDIERREVLPGWLSDFANNLAKQSVESKTRAQHSIYDQISSIMGYKSKHSTVDAAVEDMKERSGLNHFTKLQSHAQEKVEKKSDNTPELFKTVPQLQMTATNYIESTRGNLPLPAIIDKLKTIHRSDVSNDAGWDDPKLIIWLNNKNIGEKKKHPNQDTNLHNLGKVPTFNDEEIDPSNDDALHALTPSVKMV